MLPPSLKKFQFTRLIKAHGRLREFNFLRHNVKPAGYYSVDTVDDRYNRIIFTMYDEKGIWKIQEKPGLPVWMRDVEHQLHEMIMEQES